MKKAGPRGRPFFLARFRTRSHIDALTIRDVRTSST